MKVAHLILAHKNPVQLEKLLDSLYHPNFHFFIHIDKKTNIDPFTYLLQRENTYFIKNRVKVYWASYGTIQATINGFKEILDGTFDYINVISAQDYPLKPATYIYDYLLNNQGLEFITCESLDSEWQEAKPRFHKYHLVNWRIPGKYRLAYLANKILPKRKFPLDYIIVGRANWFTITSNAAKYILFILKTNPAIVRYFKYCWGADEFIFSTILFNSHFKEKINRNLVYVDWDGCYHGHPRTLQIHDFEKLKKTDKLFARKFDIELDAAIIDLLEDYNKVQKNKNPPHIVNYN